MRVNKRTFAPALIVPESVLAPLDLVSIFGRKARIEVDLGCGDGGFLVALAEQDPTANFLGVERLVGRVRSASRKIGARCLTNARIVQLDILDAVQQLFSPGSVEVFHLMFSDPWPKRRHYHRRVVSENFLRGVARALKTGGELRIATDHADYFAAMRETLEQIEGFEPLTIEHSLGAPLSTFEKHYRNHGVEIHRLTLRRVSGRRNKIVFHRSP
ncbi:MAG: tRNA (guanosine(46)-N7)-methyltransferase TrmB [Verrucomicrobiota bacterium]|nr:tRNA (guanosine(46)-N7)-methyltransferase TrmB [Verrucomicrobiota bacterium]